MPKYKRVAAGRGRYVEASINIKDRGGKPRYSIKINNLDRQDFEDAAEPTKWTQYEINDHWRLVVTKATRQTGFTEVGEVVCLLTSRDGRRMRIRLNDFTVRDLHKLTATLCHVYGKANKRRRR